MKLEMLSFLPGFARSQAAATSVLFGLGIVPLAGMVGAGVDYSRALATKTELQNALDAAVLAGAGHAPSGRDRFATFVFTAQQPSIQGSVGTPSFSAATGGTYAGSVSATLKNTMLQIVGISTTTISVTSTSSQSVNDSSCILTLGKSLNAGDDSMTFNGGSRLNLSGCTLQSNTSMVCNGNTAVADKSLAAGTVSKCQNAVSNSMAIADTYSSLAANLTRECGVSVNGGLSWTPLAMPPANKMVTVVKGDRTEYHVCGPLTLSGSGALAGVSTTWDTIIVVENGGVTLAPDAAISATRVAIVLTASTTSAHVIDFPNGKGHGASLTLSPPIASTDPWAGIALYQDPSLTTGVDMTWGPGATLDVDGVMYFPNAALTVHGSGNSGASGCTKIVADTLTSDGSFTFSQSAAACSALGVTQYSASPRLLN